MKNYILSTILACGLIAPSAYAMDKKLKVATSFSILADITQQIGGEQIEVQSIVPIGKITHGFELRPSHAKIVSSSDLIFINGLGFDDWADRFIEGVGFEGELITLSKGAPVIHELNEDGSHNHDDEHGHDEDEHGHDEDKHAEDEHGHDEDKHAEDEHGHDEDKHAEDEHGHDEHGHKDEAKSEDVIMVVDGHDHEGNFDAHLWLNIDDMKYYAQTIAKELQHHKIDASKNLAAFEAKLNALQTELDDLKKNCAEQSCVIVTAESNIGYFADAIGAETFSYGDTLHGFELSAQELAEFPEKIASYDIRMIAKSIGKTSPIALDIAEKSNAKMIEPLLVEALYEDIAEDYFSLMAHNIASIKEALAQN